MDCWLRGRRSALRRRQLERLTPSALSDPSQPPPARSIRGKAWLALSLMSIQLCYPLGCLMFTVVLTNKKRSIMLAELLRDESGQDMTEYALLLTLIGAV